MDVTKILIALSRPILGENIENLLKNRDCVEVERITPGSKTELYHEMEVFQPNSLILDNSIENVDPNDLIAHFLGRQLDAQAMLVFMDQNLVQVFEKREVTIQAAHDFYVLFDQVASSDCL